MTTKPCCWRQVCHYQFYLISNRYGQSSCINIRINNRMELKCWLLAIRIVNIIGAVMMLGFQIWFFVDLFTSGRSFFYIIIRMFVPAFIILLGFVMITSEFKFNKMVEHFKFLQSIPGMVLFYTFIASIMAFQFGTEQVSAPPIITACLFLTLAITMIILGILKPPGGQGLLTPEQD